MFIGAGEIIGKRYQACLLVQNSIPENKKNQNNKSYDRKNQCFILA
jgi:hypothetical protein